MKQKSVEMAMLFDFYGDMLTEKQREYFDLYYNEDLSLAEIAENEGISRQGVRDIIVRAEGILKKTEDTLGIYRRYGGLAASADKIAECAREIAMVNNRYYSNPDISARAQEIYELACNLSAQSE